MNHVQNLFLDSLITRCIAKSSWNWRKLLLRLFSCLFMHLLCDGPNGPRTKERRNYSKWWKLINPIKWSIIVALMIELIEFKRTNEESGFFGKKLLWVIWWSRSRGDVFTVHGVDTEHVKKILNLHNITRSGSTEVNTTGMDWTMINLVQLRTMLRELVIVQGWDPRKRTC